jgi:hypothetical protein
MSGQITKGLRMATLGVAVMLGCASGAQGGSLATGAIFNAQTLPVHYRVLGATFSTRVQGSEPGGLCDSFGGTSGATTLAGALTGPPQDDPTNKLDAVFNGGPLEGGIYAKTPSTVSTQISGCDEGPTGLQACTRSYTNVPLSGPFNIGFGIWVSKPTSVEASLRWMVSIPGIGDSIPTCDVSILADIPYARTTQTVPLSKLLSTDPQTFIFSGSMHFDQDALGRPASIDFHWRYSITVQRQDKSRCPALT